MHAAFTFYNCPRTIFNIMYKDETLRRRNYLSSIGLNTSSSHCRLNSSLASVSHLKFGHTYIIISFDRRPIKYSYTIK